MTKKELFSRLDSIRPGLVEISNAPEVMQQTRCGLKHLLIAALETNGVAPIATADGSGTARIYSFIYQKTLAFSGLKPIKKGMKKCNNRLIRRKNGAGNGLINLTDLIWQ